MREIRERERETRETRETRERIQKRHRRLKLRGEREEEHGFVETGLEQCACRRKSERRDSWREQAPGREPFPCGRPSPSPSSLPEEESNASIGRLYFDVHSGKAKARILALFLSYEFSLSQRSNPTTNTCDVFVKRSSVWEYSWAERFQCRVCV